jgi:hypothetical protein
LRRFNLYAARSVGLVWLKTASSTIEASWSTGGADEFDARKSMSGSVGSVGKP